MTLSLNILSLLGLLFITNDEVLDNWRVLNASEKSQIIKEIQLAFDHPKVEIHYNIKTFADHESISVMDLESGLQQIEGEKSRTSFMHIETFQDRNYRVVVNPDERSILISDINSQSDEDIRNIWKKFLAEKCTMKLSENEVEKKIQIMYPGDESKVSTYLILDKNNVLKSAALFMTEFVSENPNDPKSKKTQPRIEIEFKQIDWNPQFTSADLDYSKVLFIKGKEIELTKSYKNFSVIDSRYFKHKKS